MALRRRKAEPAASTRGKAKAKPPRGARRQQLKTAFRLTRESDPRLVPLMLAAFLAPLALLLAIGFVIDSPILLGILGLMVALLVTMTVFGKRVQKTAYAQVEGQVGAAAAVLQNMRGDWRVTPAVGFTREQDLLHRVVGRPGVILVAEGSRSRTRNLVVAEKKRVSRIIGETPVYDVYVGDGEGAVPLRGLERHFLKLPRNIKPKTVNELDRRMKAIGGASLPIPKGPLPKGGRVPRGKIR